MARMRPGLSVVLAATWMVGATLAAHAQTASSAGTASDGGIERRIERIRIEDSRLVADEMRHGGETQSIQVSPRGLPAYEIQPTDGARGRPFIRDGLSQANGARVWNLVRF